MQQVRPVHRAPAGSAPEEVATPMTIDDILAQVAEERAWLDRTVRIDWPAERWLAVLGDRVGGVCQAVMRGGHDGDLQAALVDVAAACGAWMQALLPYEPPGELTALIAGCARSSASFQRLEHLILALASVAEVAHLAEHGPQSLAERLGRLGGVAVAWAASIGREA